MADQKRESPSFLQVIADARSIPEGIDPLAERDAPSLMGQRGDTQGLVAPPEFGGFDQIAAQVRCLQFSEILVLWRPWETCMICKHKVEADTSLIPDDGAYTCPHTQNKRYKEIIDKCLAGKGMLATKEFFNLKNGTRVVHVEWLEGDPEHIKKLQKEQEEAKARQVYPPDPVAAFAKGKKKT